MAKFDVGELAMALAITTSETTRLDTRIVGWPSRGPAGTNDGHAPFKVLRSTGQGVQRTAYKAAAVDKTAPPSHGHVHVSPGTHVEVYTGSLRYDPASRRLPAKRVYVVPLTFQDEFSGTVNHLESLGVQVVRPDFGTPEPFRGRVIDGGHDTRPRPAPPVVAPPAFHAESKSAGWVLDVDVDSRTFVAAVEDDGETVDAEFRFDDVLDDERDLIQVGAQIEVIYGTRTSEPGFRVSIPEVQGMPDVSWSADEMFPVDRLRRLFGHWSSWDKH